MSLTPKQLEQRHNAGLANAQAHTHEHFMAQGKASGGRPRLPTLAELRQRQAAERKEKENGCRASFRELEQLVIAQGIWGAD